MGKAFTCDLCRIYNGESESYHEGKPYTKLYQASGHDRAQRTTYDKVLDLCEEHAEELELDT